MTGTSSGPAVRNSSIKRGRQQVPVMRVELSPLFFIPFGKLFRLFHPAINIVPRQSIPDLLVWNRH
jgi:hypothetical protein